MADLVGRTIGNYVVQKEVGRGGMGAVYLAEHPRLKRRVAVKVLHPEMSRDAEMVTRFFNEARAASDIRNAHIVDILDFGELPDGTSYLIMEWLDGRSLGEVIKADRRMALPRAAHIACGVGRALAAAHAHGVVHRDLKPDNIFLVRRDDDPDFVKVLDFGIAKLLVAGDGPSPRTATNVVLGTPAYMSPEQCRGESSTLDGRSDIYSLGVILYELATGRRPFNAETYTGILVAHVTQQPPAPRTHEPSIPEAAERVILRALEKEREKRYPRVEELVNEFAAAIGVPGITAPGAVPPAVAHPALAETDVSTPSGRSATLMAFAGPRPTTPRPGVAPAVGPAPSASTPSPSPIASPTPSQTSSATASPLPAALITSPGSGNTDVLRPATQRAPIVAFAGGGLVALLLIGFFALRHGDSPPAAGAPVAAAAVTPSPSGTPAAAPPALPAAVASPPPPSPAPGAAPSPAPPGVAAPAPASPPSAPSVTPSPAATPAPALAPSPTAAPAAAATSAPRRPASSHPSPSLPDRNPSRPTPTATTTTITPSPLPPPPPAPRMADPPPPPAPRMADPPPPPRPADPAPARRPVDDGPADDLDKRLASEAAHLVPSGAKRHGAKLSGTGKEGEGQARYMALEAGHCYLFVTVGSESTGRIYTYLWNPSGERVATDRADGTVSSFKVCAETTGQYHFEGKPARGAGSFRTAIYLTR